jgi:protein-disulfide isomerase
VLGAEREIIANEVAAGQVRLVFWPMLDLGPNSLNAAATAFCAGEQDPTAFWAAHDTLFENQRDVYGADRQYFLDVAAGLGLDATAFAACYDGAAVRDQIAALDAARREAGIFNRPTFDLNGQRLIGAQPYDAFATAISNLLP